MKCPMCAQEMVSMTPSHLKKHDMTSAEFREKYPNAERYGTMHKPYSIADSSTTKPFTISDKERKDRKWR